MNKIDSFLNEELEKIKKRKECLRKNRKRIFLTFSLFIIFLSVGIYYLVDFTLDFLQNYDFKNALNNINKGK